MTHEMASAALPVPPLLVLEKKDKTGRVSIAIDAIESFEEVLGATTDANYVTIYLRGGKTFAVAEAFSSLMHFLHCVRIAHEFHHEDGVI